MLREDSNCTKPKGPQNNTKCPSWRWMSNAPKRVGEYGDFPPLGDIDAGQIEELLDRFHRLPYLQLGLAEDHCPSQVLVSHDYD